MPTKHPSAWRLNKGEQQAVERDLATWEAALSEEEKNRLREDERKRLIRLTQEQKHAQSLQKQAGIGAKNKAKAAGNKALTSGQEGMEPSSADQASSCNGDYYESLKQDLAVISQDLGANLKEMNTTPIAATVQEKSGIQDTAPSQI